MDRAISSLSGFGVSFIPSTIFLMGLSVFLAMNDAGMTPHCLLTLFCRFADDDEIDFFDSAARFICWTPSLQHTHTLRKNFFAERVIQETQLSLTNLRDAFIGQSKSPNIVVPFHMLDIVSYCENSNFVFKIFYDIRLQKCRDLEIRVIGHSKSLNEVPFHRFGVVSEIFDFKNAENLKTWLGVRQGHWKCHHVIERIWLPIDVL